MKRLAALTGCLVGTAVLAASLGGTASADEAATVTASKTKTVGIVDLVQSDPLNVEVIRGVTAAAKAKGWKVKVFDANGNADAANAAFKRYASQKVDMILDLAFPVTSVRAGLTAA